MGSKKREDKKRKSIGIGIPCYGDVSIEVFSDYMRMMFSFGRRYTDYDFFLITKGKSEQFRARNAIVETALTFGCDYLLFLDDDQIIDWREMGQHDAYGFLQQLLDADKDIVGALYYHRGGDYRPVLMKRIGEAYSFLGDQEITGDLQEVDVQGGGCMLIKMNIFDKIQAPYFEPEQTSEDGNNYGTDIQLCRRAQEHGFGVWCHTGVVLGHLKSIHEVVTPLNRDLFMAEAAGKKTDQGECVTEKWYKELVADALEYTGLTPAGLHEESQKYTFPTDSIVAIPERLRKHYAATGVAQLARQVHFHGEDWMRRQALIITTQLRGQGAKGLDYGCGCAPVGFQLLKQGHNIDFVDIDGASGYEFLKWRVEKEKLSDSAGWDVEGPYDFVLMLDSIEHLLDWREVIDNITSRMVAKGIFITNFFRNQDFDNPEHVNMDHAAVQEFLIERKLYPTNDMVYVKQSDLGPVKALPKVQE